MGYHWNVAVLGQYPCLREPRSSPQPPDCAGAFNTTVADEDRSYTYSGTQTTHGETYHVEVAVCNEQGCSTPQ